MAEVTVRALSTTLSALLTLAYLGLPSFCSAAHSDALSGVGGSPGSVRYVPMAVRVVPTSPLSGEPEIAAPGAWPSDQAQTDIRRLEALASSEPPAKSRAKNGSGAPVPSKPNKRRPQSPRAVPSAPQATPAPPGSAKPAATYTEGMAQTPASASWLLGLIYLHGAGTVRNNAQAQHWFEQAWALGEPWASAGLAWCNLDGCASSPDYAAAQRWISRLRPLHEPRALYLEWLLHRRTAPMGNHTEMAGAEAGLMRAGAAGDVQALIELGMQAVTQGNLGPALLHFQAAADRSEVARDNASWVAQRLRHEQQSGTATTADELLAQAQRAHRGEDQVANYSDALRLYQLAQSKGSLAAGRMLALIYSRPGPDGQLDVQWMRQLAFADPSVPSPRPGQVLPAHGLQREPTPLADLLPPIWRRRITTVGP